LKHSSSHQVQLSESVRRESSHHSHILNRMKSLCEDDLLGFQGKHFQLLDLSSIQLNSMTQCGFDWEICRNPLRNMSMEILDLPSNGFNVDKAKLFFSAIRGTKIPHLILEHSTMGKSFCFSDNSGVKILDLSKCFIFTLQYAVFSPLREVQDLTIAQNKMNKIEFFGLQWLNLSHNLIGEIYSYTFENLPSILELDLSYNHIGALGYQAFTGLPHLQVLDLTENFFRDLGTNGYLAPLPNIQLLRLTDSKITSLEGLAGFADSTIILNIQNNRVTHLEDVYIHCFRTPLCSLNSLQALPDGIFKGLISLEEMRSPLQLPHIPPIRHFPRDSQNTSPLLQFLASPDPAAFHSLSWINLCRNRFHCDCGLEDFLTWLNRTNVPFPDPGNDEGLVQELRLSLFVCSALITVGTIVLDAYLCFSNNEYKWVETALLKKLDFQLAECNILHCCFEARDFIPGEDHLSNIRDSIWGSRKTVCIVSKEFLKDGWCLEAFTLAPSRMLEELRDVLIMVIVGKVPHYGLMKCEAIRTFLQKREYLQRPEDTQDIEWFYEKLMSKILNDRKIKKDTAKDNNGDITLVNMQAVGT
uniref:TIR domain-containing protein n=1 Tax=Oncorhynchus mykiss TaxID=8022 RepID=A0A8C7Q9A1_ONCMY